LDCEEWSEACEPWLWWRGKDSVSRTWRQRWKRDNWIRVLSTRTYSGSLGTSIEDLWISSLVASRVNLSATLEVVKPPKIADTSGPTSKQESLFSDRASASSRTSMGSPQPSHPDTTQFSTMSSATWKKWVSTQRRDSSQRRKSARRTCGSDGSSWPTPTARDWKGCGNATLRKDGKSRLDTVEAVVKFGRQDPESNNKSGSRPGQLNPDWVNTLMGFPVGWTGLGHWETQSCLK
jgi:hypothetical protein